MKTKEKYKKWKKYQALKVLTKSTENKDKKTRLVNKYKTKKTIDLQGFKNFQNIPKEIFRLDPMEVIIYHRDYEQIEKYRKAFPEAIVNIF